MHEDPTPPPALVPDTEDWTWVLDRPCPECGFVAADVVLDSIGDMIRDNVSAWHDVLARPDVGVRHVADRWSPLEYACHIGDVFRVYLGRLDRMLTEDGPNYANWDQDATAVGKRYHLASPPEVAADLTVAGAALADRFDSVAGDQWQRTGFRSDGAAFTVGTIGPYLVHDLEHHLWDVGHPMPSAR